MSQDEKIKQCSKCGEYFPLSDYPLNKVKQKKKDGTINSYSSRSGSCISCVRKKNSEYMRKYRKDNPRNKEKQRDYMRRYRKRHEDDGGYKERRKKHQREYRERHGEKIKEKQRAYSEKGRKELKDWYIIHLLRVNMDSPDFDIPKKLIELKRDQVKLTRAISNKEKNNE